MRLRMPFNRGAFIAVAAVLGVGVYLIALGFNRDAQIPDVKKVVDSYLRTYVSYSMLPEQYRTANPAMPQNEIDRYITQMNDEMKSYFATDDSSYGYVTNALKKNLERQTKQANVMYSYTKDILQYTSFDFGHATDTVTVTLETNSTYDGPDLGSPNAERVQLNEVAVDTVMLKKVDGSWKVAYANITIPSQPTTQGNRAKPAVH